MLTLHTVHITLSIFRYINIVIQGGRLSVQSVISISIVILGDLLMMKHTKDGIMKCRYSSARYNKYE